MKSVRRGKEEKKGALDVRFMPTCLKLSFFPLTVGAVCGWRGVGWISRKGGWDAQTGGRERGGTKNTVSYCRGRSWQTVRGGSGLYEAGRRGGTEGG